MRKSNASVQRGSVSVHHFNDRDPRLFESGPSHRTVINPGKNDSARIPAEKISDQRLLAVRHVFRAGDQNLETGLRQDRMQTVQQRDIHRVMESRQNDRNESDSARRKATGGAVGHITSLGHRIQNPLPERLRDKVRFVERARNRHCARTDSVSYVLKSDASSAPGRDGTILMGHRTFLLIALS